jgi:3-hydroxyisobutyrate dehydrogenase-like beta-hydroxyacid dehydrogenase
VDIALSSGSIRGKTFVDTSTVHPDTVTHCSEKLTDAGASFIASPVFGASAMAASGKLIFALAGPKAATDLVKPLVLNVMGRSIIDLGEDVSKSSMLKIAGWSFLFSVPVMYSNLSIRNVIVIGLMEVISEVQVFAEKIGLGTEVMEKMIADMFGPVAESYSNRYAHLQSPLIMLPENYSNNAPY